jgi:ATP-binding cassette subfamily C protein
LISLISECLVVLALFALIFLVDANTAGLLTALGGALVYAFYRIFRGRMLQIGTQLQDSSGKMIQYAQEGLGGVKEIKVMGREAFFEDGFALHVERYARALRRAQVIHNFPMHFLETLFVASFAGLLIFLTVTHKATNAFPLMGVYAAAAFRLIPSLSRIMTATNRIKQSNNSLMLVVTELSRPRAEASAPPAGSLSFTNGIRVSGLHYQYPGSDTDTLKNISLDISQGEMIGFVGRSGSGKTTLIDCLLGLLEPTRGAVLVDGIDIRENLPQWRRQVGYIPQNIFLTDDSLRKNIALGLDAELIDEDRLWRALEAAQLADFVRELPAGLETTIGERGVRLSGGQRQRIGIARAMYHDPAVLILDEATSALDNETEKAIVETLGGLKREKTILVIAHRMTTIENCDRVFVLQGGEFVASNAFVEETELPN